MADERRRKFFSGRSVEQAVVAAANYHGIDPSEVEYREIEKRHGFVRARRNAVIAVDPEHPRKAATASSSAPARDQPRERSSEPRAEARAPRRRAEEPTPAPEPDRRRKPERAPRRDAEPAAETTASGEEEPKPADRGEDRRREERPRRERGGRRGRGGRREAGEAKEAGEGRRRGGASPWACVRFPRTSSSSAPASSRNPRSAST